MAIDSGVVVFSGEATGALAKLAYSETFKGCTARGVAGGASALRLELYSDLLLALKTGSADEGSVCRRDVMLTYFCDSMTFMLTRTFWYHDDCKYA